MKNVLLVNPPIFDFTAYDFWLRPYGMLRVAGRMRHACKPAYFNFLTSNVRDEWGRGRFHEAIVAKPYEFRDIPRRYRRFGRPREEFRGFLETGRFDAALIQTGMTYWYEGVKEVIEDLRALQPAAKIILGGNYATLCPAHAGSLGADLIVEADRLEPLWGMLGVEPADEPPLWEQTPGGTGVIRLTEGCPFRCTYCSVPIIGPRFKPRALDECLGEIRHLARLGTRDVAFYDDALLYHSEEALVPFLEHVLDERIHVNFHTPNALNARFITAPLARLMVRAGVRTFFLGLESSSPEWQAGTGGKVRSDEFTRAVHHLGDAEARFIAAYIIIGHPGSDLQQVEDSMRLAHRSGARVMLAEFAPIPGTPDGERCREWVGIDEPLAHNKTAFAIRRLGSGHVDALKTLCRELNAALG